MAIDYFIEPFILTPPDNFRPCSNTHEERGAEASGAKSVATKRSMFFVSGWGWPQGTLCYLQILRTLLIASATTGWS